MKLTTLTEHLEKIAGFLDIVRSHPVASLLSAGALGTGLGVGSAALLGGGPKPPTRRTTEATGDAFKNQLGFWPELATGFTGGLGSGAAKEVIDLISGAGHQAAIAAKSGDQDAAFNRVHKEDEMLQSADKRVLADAFATMRRFAPTLATDPNAVKAFLREAATSGGGVNYNTVKLLAEAEGAINKSMQGGK